MGFAIAAAAARRGANVTLVSGVALPTPPFVQRIDVMTALEMEAAVRAAVQKQHIFIGCAAVADYRAAAVASEKIKKQATQGDELTVKWSRTLILSPGSPHSKTSDLMSLGLPRKQIMWKNTPGKNVSAKTLI